MKNQNNYNPSSAFVRTNWSTTAKNVVFLYIAIAALCGLLGVLLSSEIRDQYAKDIGPAYSIIAFLWGSIGIALSGVIRIQLDRTVLETMANYILEIYSKYCGIMESFITKLVEISGINNIEKTEVYYDGSSLAFSKFLEAVVDSHAQVNSLLNISIFNSMLVVLLLVCCYRLLQEKRLSPEERIKTVGFKINVFLKVVLYVILILIGVGSLIMQDCLHVLWSNPLPDNLVSMYVRFPISIFVLEQATHSSLQDLSVATSLHNQTIIVCYWLGWVAIGLLALAMYKIYYVLTHNRSIGSSLWFIIIMYLMVYLFYIVMFYYVHDLPLTENANLLADIINRGEPKSNKWYVLSALFSSSLYVLTLLAPEPRPWFVLIRIIFGMWH